MRYIVQVEIDPDRQLTMKERKELQEEIHFHLMQRFERILRSTEIVQEIKPPPQHVF